MEIRTDVWVDSASPHNSDAAKLPSYRPDSRPIRMRP